MIIRLEGTSAALWCPACEDLHLINLDAGGWTFDGDTERPTITPSIKVAGAQWPQDYPEFRKHRHDVAPGEPTICHSFVLEGHWQFLPDCTHELAGQTVPCVPIPDGIFADS